MRYTLMHIQLYNGSYESNHLAHDQKWAYHEAAKVTIVCRCAV
jgi:hypothetical protein